MITQDKLEQLSRLSWPFHEAEKLMRRLESGIVSKDSILFETGYGPSGLPHIGTFGEVARTSMVISAFKHLSNIPVKLICFSDDMDGMRKIPDTVPRDVDLRSYMDLPLTKVPDPFGTCESFGDNMNKRLRAFLDHFEFDYIFYSASECYRTGLFNQALLRVLECYEEIMAVMLPTLGAERQQTYSPILPICRRTGKVLQVPLLEYDAEQGRVKYRDPATQEICEISVLDGGCKAQWKVDIAMRWYALRVDFEMYGKDHLVNGAIYSEICAILGGVPPQQMFYELFLDDDGRKISKSKGNGLTIEEWLECAARESLLLFMYLNPQRAKKLHFSVIPKYMDDYLAYLKQYLSETDEVKRLANPIQHIHAVMGKQPEEDVPTVSYSLLLNLVSACDADGEAVVWAYLTRSGVATNSALLQQMVKGVIIYYQRYLKHSKKYKTPNDVEKKALSEVVKGLQNYLKQGVEPNSEEIQSELYAAARNNHLDVKEWFRSLYSILLGSESGPRFGSFVALYGVRETLADIEKILAQ